MHNIGAAGGKRTMPSQFRKNIPPAWEKITDEETKTRTKRKKKALAEKSEFSKKRERFFRDREKYPTKRNFHHVFPRCYPKRKFIRDGRRYLVRTSIVLLLPGEAFFFQNLKSHHIQYRLKSIILDSFKNKTRPLLLFPNKEDQNHRVCHISQGKTLANKNKIVAIGPMTWDIYIIIYKILCVYK